MERSIAKQQKLLFEAIFVERSELLQACSKYKMPQCRWSNDAALPAAWTWVEVSLFSSLEFPMNGTVRILRPPGELCPCCEHLLLNWAERGVLLNGKGLFAPQIDIASAAMTSQRKWKALRAYGRHSKCKCVHLGWTTCSYITCLVCLHHCIVLTNNSLTSEIDKLLISWVKSTAIKDILQVRITYLYQDNLSCI